MSEIALQLEAVRRRVDAACLLSGRGPQDVALIAVSKTFPAEDISAAVNAGQKLFGESRIQEAAPKVEALPSGLEWHFIGRVQRNKVRKILPLFQYVHAVDSLKLVSYIDGVAEDLGVRPKIFLQVNQAGEESKGGFGALELAEAIGEILGLKYVELVGLMSIPPAADSAEDSRQWFAGLREMRDELVERLPVKLPFLSMGMSGDFEVAIEEGATHVRVGSSIFGRREYKIPGELG